MIVKLLTEHDLESLSLKGGCTGSSECTLVKMPHCWKSHALAQLFVVYRKEIYPTGTLPEVSTSRKEGIQQRRDL